MMSTDILVDVEVETTLSKDEQTEAAVNGLVADSGVKINTMSKNTVLVHDDASASTSAVSQGKRELSLVNM